MGDEAGRRVSLALVSPGGRPLGALPPFEADVPWENNVVAVVAGARAAYGIDVTVLRLLWVDSFEDGGPLGYLAEYDGPPLEGLGRAGRTRRCAGQSRYWPGTAAHRSGRRCSNAPGTCPRSGGSTPRTARPG